MATVVEREFRVKEEMKKQTPAEQKRRAQCLKTIHTAIDSNPALRKAMFRNADYVSPNLTKQQIESHLDGGK